MGVRLLDPAEAELRDAIAYYNAQSEGLGAEFAREVRRCIERIVDFPKAWARVSSRTRRCCTNRFPYGLLYPIRDQSILIVAVMHMHREPETWRSRLSPDEL